MWDEYQPVIVKKIFYPFLVYLGLFIFLSSSVAGDYLKKIDPDLNATLDITDSVSVGSNSTSNSTSDADP
jgi:hypothetical protein